MRLKEKGVAPLKYLNLYLLSQGRIKDEQIISESLLRSLIMELRTKEVDFFVSVVLEPFFNDSKKKAFKELFFSKMNELFFDDIEWKFENINSVGYDTYGYQVYFKLKKQRYGLFVPYPKNINIDNITSASYGRYSLTIETKPSVYHSVVSSYDTDDIKVAIKKESEV